MERLTRSPISILGQCQSVLESSIREVSPQLPECGQRSHSQAFSAGFTDQVDVLSSWLWKSQLFFSLLITGRNGANPWSVGPVRSACWQ